MIYPLSPVIYENRTSFTTLTPFAPVLPWLHGLDACAWSKTVYGWYEGLTLHVPRLPPAACLFCLENLMGRMAKLKIYGETIWEGMVYEVTAALPGGTLTRSMADMANKVFVEYSDELTGANEVTSAADDTDSQTKYGTKEVYVAGGTRDSTSADAYAARYLASHKDPPMTREVTDRPPGTAELTIICKGYFYTLSWQYYTSTTSGTQDSATTIGDIATAEGAFLNATQDLDATSRTAPRHFAHRQTAWEQMLSLIALGTSNDLKYFCGVKNDRKITGWEEPITLKYVKYPFKPGQYFDSGGGFPLQYWQVEPGRWLRVTLTPSETQAVEYNNPRNMMIGSCEYDGVARTVRPSYGVKVPRVTRPTGKSKEEADPFAAPWTAWEQRQGYRRHKVRGRWVTQYMRWYKEDVGLWPYGPHKTHP